MLLKKAHNTQNRSNLSNHKSAHTVSWFNNLVVVICRGYGKTVGTYYPVIICLRIKSPQKTMHYHWLQYDDDDSKRQDPFGEQRTERILPWPSMRINV